MPRFSIIIATTIALACTPGCSSEPNPSNDDDSNEEKDSGDGKVHPPPNGQHVSEDAACSALLAAQDARIKSLQCAITTRTCPALLRTVFTTACMEYDQGSVNGCIEHYKGKTTCDGLEEGIAECVVTPYPGSEPAGCPSP
jgi:hypothetical protein